MVFFCGMVAGFLVVENTMTFFFSLGEQIWWLSEFMVAWWLFMFGQIWSGFERIGRSNTKLVQNR